MIHQWTPSLSSFFDTFRERWLCKDYYHGMCDMLMLSSCCCWSSCKWQSSQRKSKGLLTKKVVLYVKCQKILCQLRADEWVRRPGGVSGVSVCSWSHGSPGRWAGGGVSLRRDCCHYCWDLSKQLLHSCSITRPPGGLNTSTSVCTYANSDK